MGRIFGTDGIRGKAGEPPLDEASLRRLGAVVAARAAGGRFLIGRDTRESGAWMSEALAAGMAGAGAEAVLAGVLPTPAVARLVAGGDFRGGAVVSASHNPWRDNGIKLLSAEGEKLRDAEEEAIELELASGGELPADPGSVARQERRWRERYEDELVAAGPDLAGLRVVLDCANGAMAEAGPRVLSRLGAEVVEVLARDPDGRNINEGCGSLHPENLARAVRERSVDLGLAFDGDGDRVILVDAAGEIRDGDDVLFVCAADRAERGVLAGNAVVGTLMTNVGLETALREAGIRLCRAPVGDRYVLERMRAEGCELGGEPSGHVIFLEHASAGDGLLTGLMVADALGRRGMSLAEACRGWTRCPQVLVNVTVREKRDIEGIAGIREARARAADSLGDRGRVLLRYSGTEPLLRVMVEGPEADQVGRLAEEIAEAARRGLG